MGFRINTNIAAMNSHRNAMMTNSGLDKSLASLSSGLRINTAADDASGMTIADSLRSQAQGLGQAINNANDGVAVVQTADGALDEYINIINSVRTKSIQAASDGQNADSRAAIQSDIDRLLQAADGIATQTQFNGQKLLDGSFTNKSFHIGAYAAETTSLSVGSVKTDSVGDVSSVKSIGGRTALTSADIAESATGNVLHANELTVNNADISSVINQQSPNSLTDASSIASAITKATGLMAQATNVLTGSTIVGGNVDAVNPLKINGVAIADTLVSAGDADGALSAAINAITSQTGVTAKTVDGALELTSKDGSNISISGTAASKTDVYDLTGTLDTGDTYSTTLTDANGTATTVSYTVTAADSTMEDLAKGLADAINGNTATSSFVTATPTTDGTNQLSIVSNDQMVSFTSAIVNDNADVDVVSSGTATGLSTDQVAAVPSEYKSGSILVTGGAFANADTVTFDDGLGKSWEVQVGTGGEDGLTTTSTMDDAMTALAAKITAENTYTAAYDTTTKEMTVNPISGAHVAGFSGTLDLASTSFTLVEQADGVAALGSTAAPGTEATYGSGTITSDFASEAQTVTFAALADTASFTLAGITITNNTGGGTALTDVEVAGIFSSLAAGGTGNVQAGATITGTLDTGWSTGAASATAAVLFTNDGPTGSTADVAALAADGSTGIATVVQTTAAKGPTAGDTVTWEDGITGGESYTFTAAGGETMDQMMTGLTAAIDAAGIYNAGYTASSDVLTVVSNTQEKLTGFAGALTSSITTQTLTAGTETNPTIGTDPVLDAKSDFTSFALVEGADFADIAATDTFTWTDGSTANPVTVSVAAGTEFNVGDSLDTIMTALATKISLDAKYTDTASYNTTTNKLTVTADTVGADAGFNPSIKTSVPNKEFIQGLDNTAANGFNAGAAATEATGDFTYTPTANTGIDSNDTVSFKISDGTTTETFSYVTGKDDTRDAALAQLAADVNNNTTLFGGAGVTAAVDTATGKINFTSQGGTGQAMTVTNATVNTDNVNANPALNTTDSLAGGSSYTVTGLSDKLTDTTSSLAVSELAASSTTALSIGVGELVINGQDMAGLYGDGSNAGTAASQFMQAIEKIDGMEDSSLSSTGVLTLAVNNGNDLNISGTTGPAKFGFAEGIKNESQEGRVNIFSDNNVQIGGTNTAGFGFEAGNYTASKNGISLDNIDVTNRDSAEVAILIADSALKQLDATRSDLGSVQNQLESTIRNISVTQVNVTSAESQIRDVDFAQESANFAKLNILAQSGSYAMSQANAVQQNVMRLLQ